jgi:malate dehydrogenase (oxaloacetate-decarboxylating)(NADP+)
MNKYKLRFAQETDARTLADAMRGADVFVGLSGANLLDPKITKLMAARPIILAMANPDPEIKYELAVEARPDAIVGTGRSDYPNQINNVLGFPFIFRGALDVHARAINDEMKAAAARSLAALAREDVPDSVLSVYGVENLRFGPDYIIPKPFDPRVLLWEAPAVAQAAMDSGVARKHIDIAEYREQLALRQSGGQRVRQFIMGKARSASPKKRLVFAEGDESKIIRAAAQVVDEGIGIPILIGHPDVIRTKIAALGLDYEPEIVDTTVFAKASEYADAYWALRQRKGLTRGEALEKVREPNVLGALMVKMGDADAFISGLTCAYPDVIRPALQIHHTRPGATRAAGVYIMNIEDRVYLFSDATVNIEPSAEDLAEIALLVADFARELELEPRVAMLSFSNFGSTPHPLSDKVRRAVEIVKARRPNLRIDGEMQADTAVSPEISDERFPFSLVRDANVLVFPSLEAANIAYKLVARLGNAQAIGPILLGMGGSVHVLQTGDDVSDIVHIAAVAAMDAASRVALTMPLVTAAKREASSKEPPMSAS